MSDHSEDEPSQLAIPHEHPAPDPVPASRRSGARTSPVAWIALLLAIVEAGALGYVYMRPHLPPSLDDRLTALDNSVQAASQRDRTEADAIGGTGAKLDSLGARVAELEQRPLPKPPTPPFDPKPLQAEIDQLKSSQSSAIAQLRSAQTAAIAQLRSGQSAEIDPLKAAIAQTRSDISHAVDLANAAQQNAQQSDQADKASFAALTAKLADTQRSVDALSERVDKEGAAGRQVASLAGSAERLARLQAASVALSIGRPTGPIPNAPPALARFADTAPPTEAALILAFPDAAAATLKSSEPDTQGQDFLHRIWTRAQSAVTVRDGDRVLVGDPAAGIVAAARERLAAGDLDGAVATLGALSGPAADAMDPWRTKAASLVDARAALASMMAHG